MNMNKNIIKLHEYECEFEILDSWIQWTALLVSGWTSRTRMQVKFGGRGSEAYRSRTLVLSFSPRAGIVAMASGRGNRLTKKTE
jgi:hypothetical protein